MKFNELLPVGSVVLLENAIKKILIIGIMPIRHTEAENDVAYDYIGVPYPEGYIGQESAMLFNHDSIKQIAFTGYADKEREIFINAVQRISDAADNVINEQANN